MTCNVTVYSSCSLGLSFFCLYFKSTTSCITLYWHYQLKQVTQKTIFNSVTMIKNLFSWFFYFFFLPVFFLADWFDWLSHFLFVSAGSSARKWVQQATPSGNFSPPTVDHTGIIYLVIPELCCFQDFPNQSSSSISIQEGTHHHARIFVPLYPLSLIEWSIYSGGKSIHTRSMPCPGVGRRQCFDKGRYR